MTLAEPQCVSCKHYQDNYRCPAFPDRIPDEILFDEVWHEKPYPGQKGDLLFEPKEGLDTSDDDEEA